MIPEEAIVRLHALGDVTAERAAQRALYTTDGATVEQRAVVVKALQNDADFLHALARVLEEAQPPEPNLGLKPFSCPYTISPEQQAELEREGRVAALKPDADPYTRFTDGLGCMGVGSWSDGPASYRQKGFAAGLAERKAKA